MAKVADEIWEFAIKNPDYWGLLKGDDEPPEVASMTPEKQEAFRAARREVQRRYVELLQSLWEELQTRSKGTVAEASFSKNKHSKGFRAGWLQDALKDNKGNVRLAIEDSEAGDLRIYVSFLSAKKRQDQQRDLMPSAQGEGEWLYYELPIDLVASSEVNAKTAVDLFWSELLAYLKAPDPVD